MLDEMPNQKTDNHVDVESSAGVVTAIYGLCANIAGSLFELHDQQSTLSHPWSGEEVSLPKRHHESVVLDRNFNLVSLKV